MVHFVIGQQSSSSW